jgi:hypothetical protein
MQRVWITHMNDANESIDVRDRETEKKKRNGAILRES